MTKQETDCTLKHLTVGVTGHRPNRLHIGPARVAKRLETVLTEIRRGAQLAGLAASRLKAVSAVAEGADRMFAEAALALGFRLEALLPFNRIDYETTFSDPATTPSYRDLLRRAEHIVELPSSLDDSKAAYEAVGRAIVDRSDIMVAIWDGKPAAGRGGSPEIIEYAVRHGKAVLWVDATRDRPPLLIELPTTHGPRQVPLAQLAARARPVSRQRIQSIAFQLAGEGVP